MDPTGLATNGAAAGAPRGRKPRVLYFIVRYPTFSETYMHEEIRNLRRDFDISIVTYAPCLDPRRAPFPYRLVPYLDTCLVYGRFSRVDRGFSGLRQRWFLSRIDRIIEEFRPDVLHAHYFGLSLLLDRLGARHGLPYTVRTHSMDVMEEPREKLDALCEVLRRPPCRRVLAFPTFREHLLRHGAPEEKVVPCWPVVNYERFRADPGAPRGPGTRVLCSGPAIPKKKHGDFVLLADAMRGSGYTFDLYARGPWLVGTRLANLRRGRPARITYADPDDMPAIYREHDWLVYPSDTRINKVGLPVSIAEAQAAGLGVCWQELPGRRDEQMDYMGGAGRLFRSIEEVPEILRAGLPDEVRARGIENARKCDIATHRTLLSDVWEEAANGAPVKAAG